MDPFTDAILRMLPRMRTFARLRLGRRVRSLATSADIAQSACRHLLELRERFEFLGDAALASLVDTVVDHKICEKARAARSARRDAGRIEPIDDIDRLATHRGASPPDVAMERERRELLAFHLERLPTRDAEALVLRHVLGLGQEEVAAHLGLTLSAARNVLFRARSRLAAAMRRSEREPR